MDFLKSIAIAASGMRAQAGRMRIISENIANAESTAGSPGGDPYRRHIVTFRDEIDREMDAHVVKLGQTATDTSAFRVRHEPDNPMADAKGRREISQRQCAGGDNRLSRRAALL
jgi:flagellar basal-body rod protein FlgC